MNFEERGFFTLYGDYNQNGVNTFESITKKIQLIGMDACFLGSIAAHPQFTGTELSAISDNPYSVAYQRTQCDRLKKYIGSVEQCYIFHKAIATSLGFSKSNNQTFNIKHIYYYNGCYTNNGSEKILSDFDECLQAEK